MFNSLDCVRNVILNFVFKITSKTNGLKTFKKLMIIIDKWTIYFVKISLILHLVSGGLVVSHTD